MAQWRNYYRLTFSKTREAIYLGHRDILRLLERTLRRANVPVKYTQGFDPRPKVSFPLVAKVGITALAEPMLLELERDMEPEDFAGKMNENLIPGVKIETAVRSMGKKLPAEICVYRVVTGKELSTEELDGKISAVETVTKSSKKGDKTVYVEDFLASVKLLSPNEIEMQIRILGGRILDPELICEAAGIEVLSVTRTEVRLKEKHKGGR